MDTVLKKPERLLAYNGEIITFQILQLKTNLDVAEKNVLAFSRKKFHTDTGKFIEVSSGQYIIPSIKSNIQVVSVCCVADVRTGINLPCILLKTCKRKSTSSSRLTLLLLHTSNEVEPYLKFKVDTEILEDLRLTDGPTVLWKQHEKLYYVSSPTSEVLTSPIDISAILWTGTIEEGTCILGITTMRLDAEHLTSTSLPNRTHQGKEFVLYCVENQKTVSGSCLIPHAYTSVLRCLDVCMIQNINGIYETSAVGASNKQLIWFQNGVPKQVFQLPSENLSKLQIAYTSRADMLCMISFASGDACAVWKDGWKTAGIWQQVENILVDDFVGRGSDQMLLLFRDDPSNLADQQAFRLTDCRDINYPADGMDDKVIETQFQENHFLMIQTLEARLQTSLNSLEELQNHVQVQDKVIKSSCDALIGMSLSIETLVHSDKKECLVSLLDDADECHYPSAEEKCSSSVDSECFVEKIWQRVIDDFLVVGVKLKDSVDISLSDIGLSLIMDQKIASLSQVTKCQTNVLKLAIRPSLDLSTVCLHEPTGKKQRLDYHSKDNLSGNCSQRPCPPSYQNDLEHTVTAVTELSSLLALNNTSCALLLHARRKNQPDCLLRGEKLIVPCGRVSISLADVLKGKHTINVFERCQGFQTLEDIFAVLSAFQKCSLHIFSPDCTLTSVRPWLVGQMQAEPLKFMPDIMISTRPGCLGGTLFIWNPKTSCDGTLTLFYRNNVSILQCLYSLKSVLPPVCVVNVKRPGGRNTLTADLAQSLEEELLALRNLVSAAASEVENNLTLRCKTGHNITSPMESSCDAKEHVQKYKESLEIEQMQINLGAHLTTSSELYRHNVLNIAQMQMSSDTLASRMAVL
ncbi:Fanconi anemia group B protein [Pseudophryne corroboree]|uniref:Fanconi anemia group B protein n=1 Tax=Pseudophryne corroboree TaxID=495146 RepID=UPI003081AB4D